MLRGRGVPLSVREHTDWMAYFRLKRKLEQQEMDKQKAVANARARMRKGSRARR